VQIVARAPPDGYTAVMAALTTNAIGMSTYTKLGYHLERDLAPVGLAGNIPHVLVAHPTLPAKNVKELIALGRARPGELVFASQGQGTLSHLEQEMLKQGRASRRCTCPTRAAHPASPISFPATPSYFSTAFRQRFRT
jgi:tripartite-type tricarboxylate transporter receptor subunit TctC